MAGTAKFAGKIFSKVVRFATSPEAAAYRSKGWDALCGITKKAKELFYKKGEIVRDNLGHAEAKAGQVIRDKSTGILPLMARHPKTTLITGGLGAPIAYHEITGKSVSDAANATGVLGYLSEVYGGDDNTVKAAGNLLIGKEKTDKIADTVEKGVNTAVDAAKEAAEAATNGWANVKNFFGSMFGLNPGAAEGAVTGVGGFSQMLSNVLGTNVNFNLPNVFMTMAAAWLTFGNFGFTGKIAGALLGALGLKNMFQTPSLALAIANGQSQQQELTEEQTVEPMVNTGRAVVPNMQTIGNDEINGPDYDNGENPEETTRRGFRR